MNLRYTSKAKNDLEQAFEWYQKQSAGLGYEFIDCVEKTVLNIIQSPKLYAICYLKYRRAVIMRFPFSVFYTTEQTEIIVHAIFDSRQNPEKRPRKY